MWKMKRIDVETDNVPENKLEIWYLERVKKLVLPISALRIFNKLHG
jgi:hypothetical protein